MSAPRGPLADQHWKRDGYVVVRNLVDARTLERLRRGVEELVEEGSGLLSDTTLRGVSYRVQSTTGRPGEPAVAPGVFRKIMFPSKASGVFRSFLGDERLLGPLRELGLAKPHCVVDQINVKAAQVGTGFPWHQDTYFLSPKQRERVAVHGGVNAVLALDRADSTNGGFEVVPGTQRLGPVDFSYDTGAEDLGEGSGGAFDDSGRVLVALQPGDAVFFHPWLVHGSGPNRSGSPRRLLTWWFLQA